MSRVRLFSALGFLLIFGSTGNAQPALKPAKKLDKLDKRVSEEEKADQNLNKTVDDYKSSLQKVAENYDQNVKTATDRSAEMKELFDQGLISRREFEQSQQAIVDARAKATEARSKIASADTMKAEGASSATEMIPGRVAKTNWSTGNALIDGYISKYSDVYGVDPYLVYCLMHQESKFSTAARSNKGARGLMQLMPGTAARYGVTKPYDLEQNIRAGTHYLKDLLTMFNGDSRLALAGYNAGEGAVKKYRYNIPPYSETRNYVKKILARYSAGVPKVAVAESVTDVDQETKP